MSRSIALVAWALCACHTEPPPTPEPLCYRAAVAADDGAEEVIDEDDLLALVLSPAGGDGHARDCAGSPIFVPQLSQGCPADVHAATPTTPVERGPERVIEIPLFGEESAVWVETARLEGGYSLGALALVERRPHGAEVVALGSLVTRTGRLALTSETVGESDVIVADGETCADPADRGSCRRSAQVLAREGTRLVPLTLSGSDAACIGPAEIDLARQEDVELPNGWSRRFALSASVDVDEGDLVVHEQIVVEESDRRAPGVPPRRVRVVDGDRRLVRTGDTLAQDRPPLWERVTQMRGSVRARPHRGGDSPGGGASQ